MAREQGIEVFDAVLDDERLLEPCRVGIRREHRDRHDLDTQLPQPRLDCVEQHRADAPSPCLGHHDERDELGNGDAAGAATREESQKAPRVRARIPGYSMSSWVKHGGGWGSRLRWRWCKLGVHLPP